MQNIQISTCKNHCFEEIHLSNIQNNIEVWEQNQFNPIFNQRKLTQITSMLKKSELNSFSFQLEIPATFFGGVGESFNICLVTNINESFYSENDQNLKENIFDESGIDISIDTTNNYHRVNTVYEMQPIIDSLFHLLQKSLKNNTQEDLEILTSLIVFEMEQLSKKRSASIDVVQKMYNISNPLEQWLSKLSIDLKFNDHFLHNVTKILH